MKKILKKLPSAVQFILLVYLSGMLIFSVFRILLLLLHWNEAKLIPYSIVAQALVMGFRFDAVINGYLLALPTVVLLLFSIFKKEKAMLRFVTGFIFIVY